MQGQQVSLQGVNMRVGAVPGRIVHLLGVAVLIVVPAVMVCVLRGRILPPDQEIQRESFLVRALATDDKPMFDPSARKLYKELMTGIETIYPVRCVFHSSSGLLTLDLSPPLTADPSRVASFAGAEKYECTDLGAYTVGVYELCDANQTSVALCDGPELNMTYLTNYYVGQDCFSFLETQPRPVVESEIERLKELCIEIHDRGRQGASETALPVFDEYAREHFATLLTGVNTSAARECVSEPGEKQILLVSQLDSIAAREIYGKNLESCGEEFNVSVGVYDYCDSDATTVLACEGKEVNFTYLQEPMWSGQDCTSFSLTWNRPLDTDDMDTLHDFCQAQVVDTDNSGERGRMLYHDSTDIEQLQLFSMGTVKAPVHGHQGKIEASSNRRLQTSSACKQCSYQKTCHNRYRKKWGLKLDGQTWQPWHIHVHTVQDVRYIDSHSLFSAYAGDHFARRYIASGASVNNVNMRFLTHQCASTVDSNQYARLNGDFRGTMQLWDEGGGPSVAIKYGPSGQCSGTKVGSSYYINVWGVCTTDYQVSTKTDYFAGTTSYTDRQWYSCGVDVTDYCASSVCPSGSSACIQ